MRPAALALLLLISCQGTAPKTYPDLEGNPRRPLQSDSGKPAVVVFVTIDCPVANQVIPELNRIHADYAAKGVRLTLVQVDPDMTAAQAREHAKAYAIKPPVVLDPGQELVRATGAEMTPEAVVVDGGGKVVYRGRINDRFAALGDARAAPRVHDLRNALDAVLAGRPVLVPRTKVVGCFIPEPVDVSAPMKR